MTLTYRQIFDEYEGKYRIQDKKIFGEVLEKFKQETGIDWRWIALDEHIEPTDYTTIFWLLHSKLFNIDEFRRLIPIFYKILEQYNYNLLEDYISFIRLVGTYSPHGIPNNVRNFISKAPYIDKIEDNKDGITIHSEKLGNITFYSTSKYFSNNYFVGVLLRNHKVDRQCHNVSWALMDYMPGSTLVTSLIPSSFSGTAYHTVIRDRENLIVDAANSCVYSEDEYHKLFQDEIICETKVENSNEDFSKTSLLEGRGMANALVLALHQQQKRL